MSVDDILRQLQGQQIRVPCLFSLSPTWHARLNPEYDDTVEEAIDTWRRSCLRDPVSYKRNVAADGAYFTRTMNPGVTKPMMKIVGTLCSWVFAWDDILDFDEMDFGPEQRENFREETQQLMRESILGPVSTAEEAKSIAPTFDLVQTFYGIGASIRNGSKHVAVREFVCQTLCEYATAAVTMEAAFKQGRIQGLEEYLENRMGSSCVYGMIAISLFARDFEIPAWLLDHPWARELMKLVNLMVSLDNDIVSIHHEIACKHADNFVILLVHHRGMTPQEAVDHCCQIIRNSYIAFEDLRKKLLKHAAAYEIEDTARTFVECCLDVRIGIVNWTYYIPRYFDCQPSESKREVIISL
ncbi:isoprenoid synthase domain-containing protein [Penicillium capsulatum]|uniref:Terpene synthase n=1 Tax=Penicillium capsulatum TaxID=69766 RepID=A0A9W9LKX3_9EURO|nr:isoprenoid synthase domain-containing protein [Penicillium capsulatum]KAJ6116305.1 isoprenoid synthase domain-containing protein [Penicillium capsulatum]